VIVLCARTAIRVPEGIMAGTPIAMGPIESLPAEAAKWVASTAVRRDFAGQRRSEATRRSSASGGAMSRLGVVLLMLALVLLFLVVDFGLTPELSLNFNAQGPIAELSGPLYLMGYHPKLSVPQ